MDKIEKIRQEIERRIGSVNAKQDASPAMPKYRWHMYEGMKEAFIDMKYFLDTLSEEPDKSLEEVAGDFVWEVMEEDYDGPSELSKKLRPSSKISDYYNALAEFFKAGAKWQKQHDTAPVDGKELQYVADKSYKIGWRDCKQQMLRIANDRYEQAMTFVTGNSEVDQAIQMDRLALVKIIEESEK